MKTRRYVAPAVKGLWDKGCGTDLYVHGASLHSLKHSHGVQKVLVHRADVDFIGWNENVQKLNNFFSP